MADLHHERVRAYFDEPEIGRLAVGQKIQIKWDAKPGQVWTRAHRAHAGDGDNLRHAQRGRGAGEDRRFDGVLLPDTNVTVTVTTSSEPNALSIPREALHSENGKPYVYKVVNDELGENHGDDRNHQPDPGGHSLRAQGGGLGGNRDNQRTALAGGRSDQGCAVNTVRTIAQVLLAVVWRYGRGGPGRPGSSWPRPTRPCRPARRTRRWRCSVRFCSRAGHRPRRTIWSAACDSPWSSGMRPPNNAKQAVKLDGQNSGDHLWLGRALGEKASRASFLSAYSWASGCGRSLKRRSG